MMEKNSLTTEQIELMNDVRDVINDVNAVIPVDWTRSQTAAVLQMYIEFFK